MNNNLIETIKLTLTCFLSAEFGMKEDLRKMEVGGVSSRDLYVKREFDSSHVTTLIDPIKYFIPSYSHCVIQHLHFYLFLCICSSLVCQ